MSSFSSWCPTTCIYRLGGAYERWAGPMSDGRPPSLLSLSLSLSPTVSMATSCQIFLVFYLFPQFYIICCNNFHLELFGVTSYSIFSILILKSILLTYSLRFYKFIYIYLYNMSNDKFLPSCVLSTSPPQRRISFLLAASSVIH